MKEKSSITELVQVILSMSKLMRGRIKPAQAVGAGSCSLLQMKTLHFIQMAKDPTMKDVADYFGITPPSATSLVEVLVKSGHLERRPSPSDRRRVHISITPKGDAELKSGFEHATSHIKKILSSLNVKDQKDLIRILKKLSVYA